MLRVTERWRVPACWLQASAASWVAVYLVETGSPISAGQDPAKSVGIRACGTHASSSFSAQILGGSASPASSRPRPSSAARCSSSCPERRAKRAATTRTRFDTLCPSCPALDAVKASNKCASALGPAGIAARQLKRRCLLLLPPFSSTAAACCILQYNPSGRPITKIGVQRNRTQPSKSTQRTGAQVVSQGSINGPRRGLRPAPRRLSAARPRGTACSA